MTKVEQCCADMEVIELKDITDGAITGDTDEMWSLVDSGGADGKSAPCSRGKHSATLLGGFVYVLGGRGSGGSVPLRDFWRYSLITGNWEKLDCRGEHPPSLQEHTATAHGHRIYVFGGEAGALTNETPLWIYDTETQIWRKLPGQVNYTSSVRRRARDPRGAVSGPRGRRGHTAHALKDCLLIYGGYQDLKGSTNELWAFHYESESWHQVRTWNPGPARHRHAAALHDERLYVHGGQCDLRDCADLWFYDTMSRVWREVRARAGPAPRSGHAAARARAHLYIFGGDSHSHPHNDLWRFHFATETWEHIPNTVKWPSPRTDTCAILLPRRPPRAPPRSPPLAHPTLARPPPPPGNILREISKLSAFHIRRAARCSYTALAGNKDSTESLVPSESTLPKSQSAFHMERRGQCSPREGDVPDLTRDPLSVPDFADMVTTPTRTTKLVYLDSEDEANGKRDVTVKMDSETTVVMPKSASVRFTKTVTITDEEDTEMSTSDYASAEKVNRISGNGFSNPHYLGPDVRNLNLALTPDSGVAPGDIELQDMNVGRRAARPGDTPLYLLIVGGKETPHVALMQSPLSMWAYRLH
ncbi:uncharacterized protein LOC114251965 [Bombyx mandarina]|uniref:Uncharacterized protein LOC114251965 n=1 Tax=Bombyx mandarina TaxID=7092 RepID=A0A6J2KJG1_BOMMA|nr:uncharacterized protein LOC114251965 [Bombyx mandarina]